MQRRLSKQESEPLLDRMLLISFPTVHFCRSQRALCSTRLMTISSWKALEWIETGIQLLVEVTGRFTWSTPRDSRSPQCGTGYVISLIGKINKQK
jgi:hypothetical protein